MNKSFLSVWIITSSLIFLSCGRNPNNNQVISQIVQDSISENLNWTVNSSNTQEEDSLEIENKTDPLSRCVDSIWACDKVKDKNREVIELSGGERQLTLLQVETETEIHLKLSEDNGMNYVTYWTFIVEPANGYRISFYDVLEDENIDFADWCQQ